MRVFFLEAVLLLSPLRARVRPVKRAHRLYTNFRGRYSLARNERARAAQRPPLLAGLNPSCSAERGWEFSVDILHHRHLRSISPGFIFFSREGAMLPWNGHPLESVVRCFTAPFRPLANTALFTIVYRGYSEQLRNWAKFWCFALWTIARVGRLNFASADFKWNARDDMVLYFSLWTRNSSFGNVVVF